MDEVLTAILPEEWKNYVVAMFLAADIRDGVIVADNDKKDLTDLCRPLLSLSWHTDGYVA